MKRKIVCTVIFVLTITQLAQSSKFDDENLKGETKAIKLNETQNPIEEKLKISNDNDTTAIKSNKTTPSVNQRFGFNGQTYPGTGFYERHYPQNQGNGFGPNAFGNNNFPPNDGNVQFPQAPNFGNYPNQQYPNVNQYPNNNINQGQFQNPNQGFPNVNQGQYPNFQNPNNIQGAIQYPDQNFGNQNNFGTYYPNQNQFQGQNQFPNQFDNIQYPGPVMNNGQNFGNIDSLPNPQVPLDTDDSGIFFPN